MMMLVRFRSQERDSAEKLEASIVGVAMHVLSFYPGHEGLRYLPYDISALKRVEPK